MTLQAFGGVQIYITLKWRVKDKILQNEDKIKKNLSLWYELRVFPYFIASNISWKILSRNMTHSKDFVTKSITRKKHI